jgi:isorenieratene synthase
MSPPSRTCRPGRRRRPWRPGRDDQAVRHPAGPGAPSDGGVHHVIVVGGGIAGLAATVALAERGVAVTLLEARHELGGRVRSWPVAHVDGPVTMSRGFHAFFRQYYNLRSLLRRSDPALHHLRAVGDYPLVSGQGHRDSFASIPRTPPLNLAAFILRSKTFTLPDLRAIDTVAAGELLDVEFPQTYAQHDGESAAQFLDRLRFPPAARHLALEVFARSFFADPADFSAGELIAMFHSYFLGSAEGLLFDVPDDDYNTVLWAPLRRYLSALGVDVRTGTAVRAVTSTPTGVEVQTLDGAVRSDVVVVAADLSAAQQLLTRDGAALLDPGWRADLAALEAAPPFAVWRVWFDRAARADRPAFLGTAGFGCVDNISVLERFEAGAAQWALRTGGSVIEMHAYALPPVTVAHDVRAQMRVVLDRLYPEFAGAGTIAEEYLIEADCPLIGTAPWAARPDVTTPDPRVVIAGDWVRCNYPTALMERAATTGFQAGNRLLAGWQLAGHDLWTVPLAARTALARHAGRAARRN